MEKLNIAELLKNCPKGMELDCTMYENVEFDYVEQNSELTYPIHCLMKINGGYNALVFTRNGCNDRHPNSKCVIFPKGKTTWEGFVPPCMFKDGDILFVKGAYSWVLIYKESENKEDLHKYVAIPIHPNHTYIVYDNNPLCCKEDVSEIRFATEEEKEKLFDAIKEHGYKWNAETKTLEKLLKFKVGDRVKRKEVNYTHIVTIVEIDGEYYTYVNQNGEPASISIKNQDNWELVPNKFDINTLKPFDKVLVRCDNNGLWDPQFFAKYRPHSKFPFTCTYNSWSQCVPYEGNEHLLGTTDDCDEFYKNW